MHELWLHIGTHKTGTTSIQRFCAAHRDELRRAGVFYPSTGIGAFPDHYAHHRVAHAIAGRDAEFDASHAREFFDRVRSEMVDGERCLISAEPMYRHVLGTGDDDAERDDPAGFDAYVDQVRECIGEFDVTVIVMLRRQDLFLESLYAEHILSTGYTRGVEAFATDRGALLDYEQRLATWSKRFDDQLSIRVFEPAHFDGPIERLFVEWLGVEWSDDFRVGARRNVTMPRALIEFKRMMNFHGQGSAVNTTYRRWLEWFAASDAVKHLPDLGRYYLQPADRTRIMAEYESGNRRLAERYLGQARLFRDSIDEDLRRYVDRPRLTDREYRKLSRLLFRQIAAGE